VTVLGQRQWGQRVSVMFGPEELDAAGEELVSAAKLIRDLDRGELTPIRNAHKLRCNGCRFRSICADPTDEATVDEEFERTVPKRLRDPEKKEPIAA